MKRGVIVGVVLAHVVVAAGILFQGCGRTVLPAANTGGAAQPKQALPEPVLPPGVQKPASLLPTTPLPTPPSKAEVKPAPLPPASTVHVVARGENLTAIARRYSVKTADLIALNHIANANRLRVGQELVVPAAAGVETGMSAGVKPVPASSGATESDVEYTVVRGDYLGKIASRHGTTVAAIKQRNGLKNDVVRVGQKLRIPVKAGAMPVVKPEASSPAPDAVVKPARPAAGPKPTAGMPAIDLDAKPVAPVAAEAPKVGGNDSVPLLEHEVQPNEDLVKIAMMYGVSVEAVKKANGMTGESVRPGQRLKIP